MFVWSARRAPRMCCFHPRSSIRSMRRSLTSTSVRASMPTTPMSVRCCIRHRGLVGSACGRRAHRRVGTGGAGRGRGGYETIIRIGLAVQPSHFKRGFQAPAPATASAPPRRRGGCCFAGRWRAQDRRRARHCWRLRHGLAQFYYSAARPSASTPRTRQRAGFPRRCWRRRATGAERHHRRAGRLCPRLR